MAKCLLLNIIILATGNIEPLCRYFGENRSRDEIEPMKATIYRSHCHSDQFDNVSRAMMAKESAKKCTSHVDCLVLLIKPVVLF